MNEKRIALVGYPGDYFLSFARALEQGGFDVYWVTAVRSNVRCLHGLGIPDERILDLAAGFQPGAMNVRECRERLAELERVRGPRVHDVILMDRTLRRKDQAFAIKYLHYLQTALTRFFSANGITLVSSGRDTALAMVSMLVSRALGIPWVAPTRLRIPREKYFFCNGHENAEIVRIRETNDEDRAWASRFLREFNDAFARAHTAPLAMPDDVTVPRPNKSYRTFGDVIRMVPEHRRVFWAAVKASLADRGNDYARYTLPRLVGMYLRRRRNMLAYRLRPPFSALADGPYCLYTLHAQPESMIDVAGSYYSDQVALITLIARSLPASHELYVKVHHLNVDGQSLAYYRRIAAIPGVRLIDYSVDSRRLIRDSAIVFALTGTVAYEAALIGRKVLTFGNNYFNVFPTVFPCGAPRDLPALIETVLARTPAADDTERIVECLAGLNAQCFDGEFNRASGDTTAALTDADLATLQVAYNTVYQRLGAAALKQSQPA